ncbi:alpha/beta fold hydrolase [Streptomyces syringium]|uniref:Pimeloyl-ACP methyl ester carboxylesterase n=1 Tax=Streptomyces syringium TaxID=76729 RepID=A0ABS4XYM8_9ACTN|nr:alpha/beta fold hydrolase [Streptomyces syringium]MBP2401628.1 pimeloyl-ACP methyl ester carboxylesterase [Streptomyces syringium]SPE47751.1 4,5:9,10-diseco-3-hydroxy-5,9, 17-trioxoandrosta-1(10),2-diene-4-oate hydrolase [Streptomyces netropsis]
MVDTISFPIATPTGRRTAEVAYERVGSGQPVVLLHGIGHHLQAWDPVVGALAAERDVIAVDLPGFGVSPALPDGVGHGLREVTGVLGALFDALGLDRPHVVGNSLGGLLALQLGHEKLVRTVTTFSPAGFWTEGERRYAFGVLRAMRHGALRLPSPTVARMARTAAGRAALTSTIYARPARRSPEAVIAETRALREATAFEATLAAGRSVLFTHDLAEVPVTVAWGTADRILLRRQGIRAKKVMPGARLIRLPGCGHVPMNDDPALVARVILDATR